MSRTVSELSRRIGQIIAFARRCRYLTPTPSFEVKRLNCALRKLASKTRNITLSCGVVHKIFRGSEPFWRGWWV